MNQGTAKCHLIGCRVASKVGGEVATRKVTYIPAYIRNDGKQIPACCKVTVFINHLKKANSSLFTITAWRKMADIFAKGMSPGKEFYADTRVHSYRSKVYKSDGNLVLNTDGTPLTVLKHSFELVDMLWGADSQKFIADEILNAKRPRNWNDNGPGAADWAAILKARNEYTYKGVAIDYGFAKVTKANAQAMASTGGLPEEVAGATGGEALAESFGGTGEMEKNVVDLQEPF